jgi:fermentation-respiration switch protein FrsA (DUF1100 family)
MTKQVKRRRGTAAEHAAFTGAVGELTVDTTNNRVRVHDGVTAGGFEVGIQTGAQIKTLYEAEASAFTDAQFTKLAGVEALADVTDATNVAAAGALMDSEVTNLAQVKAFSAADYATAAQGTLATNALPKTGGALTGAVTTTSTFDGRDVSVDGTKLDGIEALADVTDATNVTAAGALMDSELAGIAAVKALNQGVATTDSPTFAGIDVTGTVTADGLTVDGDLSVSAANSRIRLYETDTIDLNTQLQNQAGDFNIARLDDDAGNSTVQLNIDHATGNVSIPNGNLDVTGTVTADGLTVSGSVAAGAVLATISNSGASGAAQLYLNNDAQNWIVNTRVDDAFSVFNATSSKTPFLINTNGSISFYEATGTTPKLTWDASNEALRFDSATLQEINGTDPFLSGNAYYDGSNWKYATSTDATNYYQTDRQHIWRNAASGTAGNNITWSESMRIDASGNVGIRVSSPRAVLDLEGNVALDTDTATLTTTSQTSIATFAVATFDAAKVVITANNGTDTYITELLVAHDGTTAVATEYGQLSTDTFTVAYDVDISGGNVRILATPPAVTSTTFKVIKTLM